MHAENDLELAAKAGAGDTAALTELMERYEPLLRVIAAKQFRTMPRRALFGYDDVLSEAKIGFMIALRTFNPERASLPTYVQIRVSGHIQDELRALDPAPRSFRRIRREVRAAKEAALERGEQLADSEIAERLGVTVAAIRRNDVDAGRYLEMDTPTVIGTYGVEGERDVAGGVDPDEDYDRAETLRLIAAAIEDLPKLQREILVRHVEGERLAALGREYGFTESRASQIRKAAATSIRNRLSAQGVCQLAE